MRDHVGDVVAWPAVEDVRLVVVRERVQDVVPCTPYWMSGPAPGQVTSFPARRRCVVARTAADDVVALAGINDVSGVVRADVVAPLVAVDQIGPVGAVQVVGALGAADEIEARGRRGGDEHAGPEGDDEQQLASHGYLPVEIGWTPVFSSTAVASGSGGGKRQVSRQAAGPTTRRSTGSQRHAFCAVRWVPPSQRSSPSSSTRSDSPRSAHSPAHPSAGGESRRSRCRRRGEAAPAAGDRRCLPRAGRPRRRAPPAPGRTRRRPGRAPPRAPARPRKRRPGVDAPAAIASSALRCVPGEAVMRRGQLLEQTQQRGAEQLERSGLGRERRERHGIGHSKRFHASRAAASVSGVARRRLGQSVSSSSGHNSPSPRNDDLPGNEETTISSGSAPASSTSASASISWSWSYRSCSNQRTTWTPSRSARMSCRSRRSSEERIAPRLPQPQPEGEDHHTSSSSRRVTAGTGPSCRTSFQGSTAPPSEVARRVLPALSPFVTCSSVGRVVGSRPRRAR